MEHTREMHTRIFSHNKKKWRPKQKCNTYENKKKKSPSILKKKKKVFSAAKTTG
jgi:hypothetical protein